MLASEDESILAAYDFLLGLGCHLTAVLRGAFGDPLCIDSARIWDAGKSVVAMLRLRNEIPCVLEMLKTSRRRYDFEMVVFAEDETVWICFPIPYLQNAPVEVIIEREVGGEVHAETVTYSFESPYRREIEHFYDCVIDNQDPLTPGEEGVKDVELLAAIVRCAQSSTPGVFRQPETAGQKEQPRGRRPSGEKSGPPQMDLGHP